MESLKKDTLYKQDRLQNHDTRQAIEQQKEIKIKSGKKSS